MSDAIVNRFAEALRGEGLELDLGAMRVRIASRLRGLPRALARLYGHYTPPPADGFVDSRLQLDPWRAPWRPWNPLIRFLADGAEPFGPAAADTGLAQLEWGMNWVYANLFSRHLLLHAGTVEHAGVGMLMVASPGSGKSTLTAALGLRGFRILSDEFGSLRLSDRRLLPLAKPVALKNTSIPLIERWSSEAVLGPTIVGTHKGDVAHLALPAHSVQRRHEPARPGLIIFPTWQADAPVEFTRVFSARTLAELAHHSFNYAVLGEQGFRAACDLVASCRAYRLTYGRLEEVVPELARLCEARSRDEDFR